MSATDEQTSLLEHEEDDVEEIQSIPSSELSSEDELETGLTENQGRLLYLISLYTRPAKTDADNEEWIRRQALLVLIYEGIVVNTEVERKGVFDYDYAPASEIIDSRRKYFNKSQEGASDVDFLREEGLVNGLKRASKNYLPVTCYQISEEGLKLVRKMPKKDKEAVNELVFAPGTRELLSVEWSDDKFRLVGPGGYEKISSVTDTEDVSYVSSAYIPQCLRFGGRPTMSNAHLVKEATAADTSNIKDTLDQVIVLNSISVIVSEFIPFGANQIVQLNDNLGSTERVQGGFFTALMDDDSSGTKFEVKPGLTSVNILDYTLTKHINFEADIHIPADEGIVQVETFGVSANADGTMFYGMQVEAVMGVIKDRISIDHLSRLLVDVATDSTTIIDSVISAYQRRLMNLIFDGDASARDKVNLIVANEIEPHLTSEEYMDRGAYENELKQVLGDVRAAFDVSPRDTLVFGQNGLLIAGPNARHHEPLLCSFVQFTGIDLFVRNFWNRMFLVMDSMKEVRNTINTFEKDPNSLVNIRMQLQKLSDDVRLLHEVLGYLSESLEACEIPPEPLDEAGKALYERLQIADLAGQLSMRVLDLKKNMDGASEELAFVRSLADVVTERQSSNIVANLESNSRQLMLLNDAHERAASSLEIMQLVAAAILAFGILDRITGPGWSLLDEPSLRDFADPMIVNTPFIWFLINIVFWVGVMYAIQKLFNYMQFRQKGRLLLRVKVNQKFNAQSFFAYIATKLTALEERNVNGTNNVIRVSWEEADAEAWGGSAPLIVVEYDKDTEFIHSVEMHYNRRKAEKALALTPTELRNKVCDELIEAQVFDDPTYTFREFVSEDDDMGETFAIPMKS